MFERKIIRGVCGPNKRKSVKKIKYLETTEILKREDIVKAVKEHILSFMDIEKKEGRVVCPNTHIKFQ